MKMLMGVYNSIEYDGRVQRAATALAAELDLTVVDVGSGGEQLSDGYRLRRIPLSRNLPGPIQMLWYWMRFMVLALQERPDVVYAHDFTMAIAATLASRLCGAALVYDAHELIIPEPAGLHSRPHPAWTWMERLAIRCADLVVSANAERGERMRRYYRMATAPLAIENIPPVEASVWSAGDALRQYPALQRRADEFLLVYQGDVNEERGVGWFVDAMRILPRLVRMIIVGDGVHRQRLAARVEASDLSARVTFLGKVPRASLASIMACCDAGVVTYPLSGLNNIYCASNKVYEYLNTGIPVICTCQPPLKRLVDETGAGVLVGCDRPEGTDIDAEEIAERISELIARYPDLKSRVPAAAQRYDWASQAEKLVDAIRIVTRFRASKTS